MSGVQTVAHMVPCWLGRVDCSSVLQAIGAHLGVDKGYMEGQGDSVSILNMGIRILTYTHQDLLSLRDLASLG